MKIGLQEDVRLPPTPSAFRPVPPQRRCAALRFALEFGWGAQPCRAAQVSRTGSGDVQGSKYFSTASRAATVFSPSLHFSRVKTPDTREPTTQPPICSNAILITVRMSSSSPKCKFRSSRRSHSPPPPPPDRLACPHYLLIGQGAVIAGPPTASTPLETGESAMLMSVTTCCTGVLTLRILIRLPLNCSNGGQ